MISAARKVLLIVIAIITKEVGYSVAQQMVKMPTKEKYRLSTRQLKRKACATTKMWHIARGGARMYDNKWACCP
jgi:hypothetical protein